VPAIGVDYQFNDWLPRVGLGTDLGEMRVTGWCWPTTRSLGLVVADGTWRLGLSMDNLQERLAKTLVLTVAYRP
jgi:hypothetical protein